MKGRHFGEFQVLDWFTQIALALRHCHERKILHRDLKSKNVFLTMKNVVKLGDFGIAKVLNNTMDTTKTIVGTPYYLSPEIIKNKPYGLESDIWALGILLYEMCALRPPFNGRNLSELGMRITAGVYPQISSEYSRDLRVLISNLLIIDPKRRPNIHKVLKTPLIQSRMQSLMTQTLYNINFENNINKKSDNKESTKEEVQSYINKFKEEQNKKLIIKEKSKESQEPARPFTVKSKSHKIPDHTVVRIDLRKHIMSKENPKNHNEEINSPDVVLYNKYKEHPTVKEIPSTPSIKPIRDTIKKNPSMFIQNQKCKLDKPIVQEPFSPKELSLRSDYDKERLERIKKREEEHKKMMDEIKKKKKKTSKFDFEICLVQHDYTKSNEDINPTKSNEISAPRQRNITERKTSNNYKTIVESKEFVCYESNKIKNLKKDCSLNDQKEHCFKYSENTSVNHHTKDMYGKRNSLNSSPRKTPDYFKAKKVPNNPGDNESVLKKERQTLKTAEAKKLGSLKDEIQKYRKMKKADFNGRKTLDNFSVNDILVVGTNTKEQVEKVTSNINKNIQRNNNHQEDMLQMIQEMKTVISY